MGSFSGLPVPPKQEISDGNRTRAPWADLLKPASWQRDGHRPPGCSPAQYNGKRPPCRRGVCLGCPWPALGQDQLVIKCGVPIYWSPGRLSGASSEENIYFYSLSSTKALCSPCLLSSAGPAGTSRSRGCGVKLQPSKFLACRRALSSNHECLCHRGVSVTCSFQCCVHTVSCLIPTPCQPRMSPIH